MKQFDKTVLLKRGHHKGLYVKVPVCCDKHMILMDWDITRRWCKICDRSDTFRKDRKWQTYHVGRNGEKYENKK